MAAAAAARATRYYAVTDHAPNLPMQRMTDEKMLAQREQLRAAASAAGQMTLLHGTELNIDPDGEGRLGRRSSWPGSTSAWPRCTRTSTRRRAEMTRRLVRACENPYVNIIGHPTARLIGRRPPIDVDFDAVFEAAPAPAPRWRSTPTRTGWTSTTSTSCGPGATG